MLAAIINKFTGPVTIDVTPEEFIFSWRGVSVSIETYIYLLDDNGEYRILGIGEDFEGSNRCIRVELFSEKLPPNNRILRSKLLEAFIRFGMWKIVGRRIFLRPTMVFRGTQNIEKMLSGYQDTILIDAACKAGAHSVEIKK